VIKTKDRVIGSSVDLEKIRSEIQKAQDPSSKTVHVCIGTGCAAKGSRRLFDLFVEAAESSGQDTHIESKCVGCHGLCERGPIIVIQPGEILYQQVEEPDIEEIFRETVVGGRVVERLLYEDPKTGKKGETADQIPFYRSQQRKYRGLHSFRGFLSTPKGSYIDET
jgi:NADH-quinone oxidoreductase subunit F